VGLRESRHRVLQHPLRTIHIVLTSQVHGQLRARRHFEGLELDDPADLLLRQLGLAACQIEVCQDLVHSDRRGRFVGCRGEQRDRPRVFLRLSVKCGQHRQRILVGGSRPDSMFRFRTREVFLFQLLMCRCAHRQKLRIVGMLGESGGHDRQGLFSLACKNQHLADTRARVDIVGVSIQRRLIEAVRLTYVRASFGDLAVVVEPYRALGLDLCRVAEFDAGLVEIAARQIFLAALQVTFVAGVRAPATAQDSYRQTCNNPNLQRRFARRYHGERPDLQSV
jgi:hypothetical protein